MPQESARADVTKKVAGRNDLERSIPCEQDDLQRKEIATIIGDQEMGAALNACRDDWPVLEIAWNLLQVPEVAGHQLAHVPQGTDDGVYFIVLQAAKCANIGFAKSLPDLAEDVVRDQRAKVTAHQRIEHTYRSRLAPPQNATNEDVRVDDSSSEYLRHAGLVSRLG